MAKIKIYNLRIVPQEPIYSEVWEFKKEFRERFGDQPLSKSKPHITIAVFEMDTQFESQLIQTFDQLSSQLKFTLQITGFGIFNKYASVLLLKIAPSEAIINIHTAIKLLWQYDLRRKISTLKLSEPPHITISKTKGQGQLDTSFAYFKERYSYKKLLAVNQLTWVSRPYGKTWDWQHTIPLFR